MTISKQRIDRISESCNLASRAPTTDNLSYVRSHMVYLVIDSLTKMSGSQFCPRQSSLAFWTGRGSIGGMSS